MRGNTKFRRAHSPTLCGMESGHDTKKELNGIGFPAACGRELQISLPEEFLGRMKSVLGNGYNDFTNCFLKEAAVSVRINPAKWTGLLISGSVPWCKTGIYLEKRPLFTADPWFQGGAYYVQEPSSMFLEQAFLAANLPENALVLDLCGAPGGKATHLLSLMRPGDMLVTNEVIRSRASILLENIQKWGYPDVIVTQNDPKDFGEIGPVFDLVVVDAPCSGEGLFRKDQTAIKEWSAGNAALCASRQRRILAEAWKCLKPGGVLIYSTCTFNPAENEENIRWLHEQNKAVPLEIEINPEWNIWFNRSEYGNSYHFYPHLIRGEGFFLSITRKQGSPAQKPLLLKSRMRSFMQLPGTASDLLQNWISPDCSGSFLVKDGQQYFFPSERLKVLAFLDMNLNILLAGTPVATGLFPRFNPHPALAMSVILNRKAFPEIEVDLSDAIRYMRRESLPLAGRDIGWTKVSYRRVGLGWLKNLGTRTNNYFPKERRIRMELDSVPPFWHESGDKSNEQG